MACAHPFPLYFEKLKTQNTYKFLPLATSYIDYYIPCGRCLNCRVDKQNELTARCEYEYIDKKCGAFVTFTYDDAHLQKYFRRDFQGNLVATLSKQDCKRFLDRLNKIIHSMPDNVLCNHRYKYLAVGEYGQNGQMFDRPHFHILFFGLDFAYCKKAFMKAWQGQGKIDSLPILNGGIRYVLKYLDKQLFGEQAAMKYDNNNIERPFQRHSLGLGSGLFKSQLSYIKKHDNCFRWHGRDVPVPTYYKNKFLLINQKNKHLRKKEQMENINLTYNTNLRTIYDLHDFKIQNAQIREENLNKMNERSGKPRFDFLSFQDSAFRKKYITMPLAKYALSQQHVFIENKFG